jgi:PHD/YefM family antitoxin component YafN of YafNO toxin-antitoxin module
MSRHSGSTIFSGGGGGPTDALSEGEMKRIKQRRYCEELAAASAAAPITADWHSMRKPTDHSGSREAGLGIGGTASSGQGGKQEKQRQYAEEIYQASQQAPRSAEHVRRSRAKAEVGGGSSGYGGADILASPAKYQSGQTGKPDLDVGGLSPLEQSYYNQVPAFKFPTSGTEGVDGRRLKQQEYARQLQEDTSSVSLHAPRVSLSRRPRSPGNSEAGSLDPRSLSTAFARGLSAEGSSAISAGQKRDQQRLYAEALERDRVDKAELLSHAPDGRSLSSVGDSREEYYSLLQDRQLDNTTSQRERQRQYAEALDQDRTNVAAGTDRRNKGQTGSLGAGTQPYEYVGYADHQQLATKERNYEQATAYGPPTDQTHPSSIRSIHNPSSVGTSIFGRNDATRNECIGSRRGRSSGGGVSSFSIGGK